MSTKSDQLVAIFVQIDDFCKQFEPKWNKLLLTSNNTSSNRNKRGRPVGSRMFLSERLSIVILFHLSNYRTFKSFYEEKVLSDWICYFPKALSYSHFIETKKTLFIPLMALFEWSKGNVTGIQYVDSTILQVCHNKRIYSHRVFKGLAERGRSSMGWFFGFKLHVIINDFGELLSFAVTKGNVDDRVPVPSMTKGMEGFLFGDKGYLGKNLADTLIKGALKIVTKLRKNMKKVVLEPLEKLLLYKRGVVESVIEQLKHVCHIQHTRHRSCWNYSINLIAGLVAYNFKQDKPSIYKNKKSKINQILKVAMA